MSIEGLILRQCLEALVLQRIIKDAKLLGKGSKFITEREKKKKTLFFCIFLEMQGHKEMRILHC